ncbi:MAG TPA: hypothetical protein VI111_06420 [Thermoleophilaceae bacterium]
MQRLPLARLAALVACLVALAPATAAATTPEQIQASIASAAGWIRTQQDPTTGGLTGFGGDWSLTALAAAGAHPADVHGPNPGDPSLVDFYLADWTSPEFSAPTDPDVNQNPNFYTAADYARVSLLARSAGLDPARLSATQNAIAQLAALWRVGGTYGEESLLNPSVFGTLALAGTGYAPAVLQARSASLIRANQHTDGGWTFQAVQDDDDRNAVSDIDMTGAALAALCTTGATTADPAVAAGVELLESKFLPATGAFDAQFGVNADSNAWALHGLLSCGIDIAAAPWTTPEGKSPQDFLLSLQRTSGPNAGSFKYVPTEGDDDPPNLYTTQDALRALATTGFVVPPPGRENPSDPSELPVPEVPDATPVPMTLLVDNGTGSIRLCRVTAPTAATVAEVLTVAQSESTPSGCVFGLQLGAANEVVRLNGRVSTDDQPWLATTRLEDEGPAGGQPVGLGDFVYLRRPGPGAVAPADADPIDFGNQVDGTLGRAHDLYVRIDQAPVEPHFAVTGPNREDFLLADGDCRQGPIQPGAGCTLRLRFAPSGLGQRSASLAVFNDDGQVGAPIALAGTGVAAPAIKGPQGDPGPNGDAGPAGSKGDLGPRGDKGARGRPGRDATVRCKVIRIRSNQRLRCSVRFDGRGSLSRSTRATLSRHGRVIAHGTLGGLRAARPFAHGRYTLRAGRGEHAVRALVIVR